MSRTAAIVLIIEDLPDTGQRDAVKDIYDQLIAMREGMSAFAMHVAEISAVGDESAEAVIKTLREVGG